MSTTQRWNYFLTLSKWAAEGLAWAWPVTLALVLGLVGSVVWARHELRGAFHRKAVLQLSPVVIPFMILALGAWFACEDCSPSALGQGVRHFWAMRLADALLLVQLLTAAWLVRAAKPWHVTAGVLQACLLWCSLWAAFMAGMSMSGDWL